MTCYASPDLGEYGRGVESCEEEATRVINGQHVCQSYDCAEWARKQPNDGFDRTVEGWKR